MMVFRIHFTKVYQNGEFPKTATIEAKTADHARAKLKKLVASVNKEEKPDLIIHSIEEVKE